MEEEEEKENMCDGVIYADTGRRSRLSTQVARSVVDVMTLLLSRSLMPLWSETTAGIVLQLVGSA